MEQTAFAASTCFSTELQVAVYPRASQYKEMILESDPRPGYFAEGGFPEHLKHVKDHHLYVLIKQPVSCMQDKIVRHACKIKNEKNLTLHVSPGQLTFLNEVVPCIRIRTTDIDQLQPFLSEFKKTGIKFMRKKKVTPYTSFIQFKKTINFIPLDEGIFRDANEKYRYFISISKAMEFENFKRIINDAKNNCNFNMFDASLVYYHKNDCTYDMISLYSEHCDESRLPELKNFVEKEIKLLFD